MAVLVILAMVFLTPLAGQWLRPDLDRIPPERQAEVLAQRLAEHPIPPGPPGALLALTTQAGWTTTARVTTLAGMCVARPGATLHVLKVVADHAGRAGLLPAEITTAYPYANPYRPEDWVTTRLKRVEVRDGVNRVRLPWEPRRFANEAAGQRATTALALHIASRTGCPTTFWHAPLSEREEQMYLQLN